MTRPDQSDSTAALDLTVFVDPHTDDLFIGLDPEQRRIIWRDEKIDRWAWACQNTKCWGFPVVINSDGSFGLADPAWYGDEDTFDGAVVAAENHVRDWHTARG